MINTPAGQWWEYFSGQGEGWGSGTVEVEVELGGGRLKKRIEPKWGLGHCYNMLVS